MLRWLFPKKYLIATMDWTITWASNGKVTGEVDKGSWMLFQTKAGKRSFETTHVPSGLFRRDIPGYGSCVAWMNGGKLPLGAEVQDE